MKKKTKTTSPSASRTKRRDERGRPTERRDESLGYAQDAGHPGGLQDLHAKSDTEAEHDAWGRHG